MRIRLGPPTERTFKPFVDVQEGGVGGRAADRSGDRSRRPRRCRSSGILPRLPPQWRRLLFLCGTQIGAFPGWQIGFLVNSVKKQKVFTILHII